MCDLIAEQLRGSDTVEWIRHMFMCVNTTFFTFFFNLDGCFYTLVGVNVLRELTTAPASR